VAWRINRLMRLGRSLPELPADVLLQADEWKAAYLLNHKKVLKQAPPLREAIRLIAQLGGFLGRKGDGEPGAKTLWLGMRDIAVFIDGMQATSAGEKMCVREWGKPEICKKGKMRFFLFWRKRRNPLGAQASRPQDSPVVHTTRRLRAGRPRSRPTQTVE
jgi:hypothetical protein